MNRKQLLFLSVMITTIPSFAMDAENMRKHEAFIMNCRTLEQRARIQVKETVNEILCRTDNSQCGLQTDWLFFKYVALNIFAEKAHAGDFTDVVLRDFVKDERAWWKEAEGEYSAHWLLPIERRMPEYYKEIMTKLDALKSS